MWNDGELLQKVDFPPAISPYPRQILIGADGTIAYVASEYSEAALSQALLEL